MPKCINPECGKELPEGKFACNEKCLKKSLELKRTNQNQRLISEETVWFGQGRRKRVMGIIIKLAKECCPVRYKQFACVVSFRTGLSLRKLTDDYLEVLLGIGILKENDGLLTLGEVEPK
jgi:predicted nucleic acid-binding Zn ribbon protein